MVRRLLQAWLHLHRYCIEYRYSLSDVIVIIITFIFIIIIILRIVIIIILILIIVIIIIIILIIVIIILTILIIIMIVIIVISVSLPSLLLPARKGVFRCARVFVCVLHISASHDGSVPPSRYVRPSVTVWWPRPFTDPIRSDGVGWSCGAMP